MADLSKSPLLSCSRCSFSLVGRFRLVSHKGSDILTLDPVYPYGCGEVLEVCWGRSGRR